MWNSRVLNRTLNAKDQPSGRLIIILVAVTLILVAIIIVLAIVFTRDKDSKPDIPTPRPVFPPPTGPRERMAPISTRLWHQTPVPARR
ncbi:hypothetical protein OS493_001835 [Desmophyllum pertusum]|uniref:Uncharacterized protein n=1 Tax=Desmophyllum pertusum TaxID=174260 RepID=A0A9X0CTL6_9CNID|nr:hypothetical protein OS493_001835 [Desmophyllum pertusum]